MLATGDSWKYITAEGMSTEVYSRAALRDMAAGGHPLAAFGAPAFRMEDGMWLPITRVRRAVCIPLHKDLDDIPGLHCEWPCRADY